MPISGGHTVFRSKTFATLSLFLVFATLLGACSPTAASGAPVATQASGTAAPLPAGSVQINGAGATFPLPVYTEWIYAYQYVDPSVVINYQGIGSGGGKKGIVENTLDFAGSDSLLKDEEYTAGKDLQMYPMLAGAVVPIYNIEGITTSIVLDRVTLANIYLGTVKNWNDPAIAATNPNVKFPDAPISVVHRSDG